MTITLHKNDIPANIDFGDRIAIDTETMGLKLERDPLCLVQLSAGDDTAHIVQLDRSTYDAPNLKALLSNKESLKIFHFARFDIAILKAYLDVDCGPIFCTRTASRLVRTYTDRHGLRDCCRELLGVNIDKQQQSSDWGSPELSEAQRKYAAGDVLYLHALQDEFEIRLIRENRRELAYKCFDFLPVRAELDLAGWPDVDLFAHQ